MAEEGSLASRRPRRSTAGNRMELALAELELEEPQEAEEDIDFVVEKDEEDVFESDFASTDEEAVQEDIDEGDRAVREEDQRKRKTARSRVEKAAAAAHARQRVTFNPDTSHSHSRPQTQKARRRVSLGVVVNAETGEVIEGGVGTVGTKRQSKRRHTVMNTSATVNRIKDAEVKRAAIPKKMKTVTRLPTQDELIARALDTEEGNITEHKNYLRLEEEKRAKARVIKQAVDGPVLRWISKKETIQVEVQLAPPTTTAMSANLYAAKYSLVYASGVGGTVGSQAYSMPFYAYTPFVAPQTSVSTLPTATTSSSSPAPHITLSQPIVQDATPATGATSVPSVHSWQSQAQSQPQASAHSQAQSSPALLPSTPTAPFVAHRTENICKNYVIHQVSQSFPYRPPWNDTMSAMFGDHVQWGEVKVFTGKGRPLSRPVRTCPITGLPAKYRDPRTNVPFANIGAYETLTKVMGREYVWCSALGCYVGKNGTNGMDRRPGGEAGRGPDMMKDVDAVGADTGLVEGELGDENTKDDEDSLAERATKRRRVGTDDG